MAKGFGSVLTGGMHLLGIKEIIDTITNFLKENKDNPLLRSVIEKTTRELKEEVLTREAVKKMADTSSREKIEKFFGWLKNNGKTGDLQDIENVVLAYIIFENIGIPLTQSTKRPSEDIVAQLRKFETDDLEKKLSFKMAIEYLEDLSKKISGADNQQNYQEALEWLGSYRFIDQAGKSILLNLSGGLGKTAKKFFQEAKKHI